MTFGGHGYEPHDVLKNPSAMFKQPCVQLKVNLWDTYNMHKSGTKMVKWNLQVILWNMFARSKAKMPTLYIHFSEEKIV